MKKRTHIFIPSLANILALSLLASCTIFNTEEKIDNPSSSSSQPNEFSKVLEPDKKPVNKVAIDKSKHEFFADYLSPDRLASTEHTKTPAGFVKAPGGGLAGYKKQQINWTKCGSNECAKVIAPLDYANPDKQAITLKMRRVKSIKGGKGPLFVNPGGPGGSAQDFVQDFGPDRFPGYDLIGLDPRGSGESTPVKCGSDAQMDKLYNLETNFNTAAGYKKLVDETRKFALQCRYGSGELLDHISTIENVRDMDLVRGLLGAEKMNFLGVSYGTYIGAMYAEFFPKKVGHLILDSAVNITDDDSIIQASGFERALNNFVKWATKNTKLGSTPTEVIDKISKFMSGLDKKPLNIGNRQLTKSKAASGIAMFLYADEAAYSALNEAIEQALSGDGAMLLATSDALSGRAPDGHWENISFAFPAISCIDEGDKGIAEAGKTWNREQKLAPHFAKWMGPSVTCEVWTSAAVPHIKIRGKGAPPILVIGTTGDSATPFEFAVSMSKQLDSGVLIEHRGAGHGSYSTPCVKKLIGDYLAENKVPPNHTVCVGR